MSVKEANLPVVSFVIIYTNDKQIEECNKWIDKQDYKGKIEKIILDNRNNKSYSSGSSALNDGARKATGEIIFFMHQDIYLWDVSAVSNIVNFIGENDCIIGSAGIAVVDNQCHYDMTIKSEQKQFAWGTDGKILEATVVDECLMVMKKNLWKKLQFDEVVCDNWHLYGVDICLRNNEIGNKNYIFPLKICHDSFGSPFSKEFRETAYKLCDKYAGKLDRLHTTCIDCEFTRNGIDAYFRKRKRRMALKKFLKRIGLFKLVNFFNKKIKNKKGIFVLDD